MEQLTAVRERLSKVKQLGSADSCQREAVTGKPAWNSRAAVRERLSKVKQLGAAESCQREAVTGKAA